MSRPLTLALIAVALLAPRAADACGGFFCNASDLIAVEQNQEVILFQVNGDDTVTVDVEITYTGSPESFAWVVPVSDTPTLNVVPPSTLKLLDAATAPRIIPPYIDYGYGGGDDDSGWGDDDDMASDDDDVADDDDAVEVEELPQVGPYDPTVVSSDDPAALIDWLNDNGYLITPEMEPYIATYVAAGLKFLGLKLDPEAGIADIAPISMTYPGDQPMIPLVLTGVAAEPEMSVVVFVIGNNDWEALNYASLEVPEAMVQADPRTGENNYHPLLSWLADQSGGQAFFKEYTGSTWDLQDRLDDTFMGTADYWEARDYLDTAMTNNLRVTRLYARMDGAEMLVDPMFVATTQSSSRDNIYNLTGRPAVWWDTDEVPRAPCNDTYCGRGGSCATTDFPMTDGCLCDEGWVARPLTAPNGMATVTCQDASHDLMASADDLLALNNPCQSYDCGSGNCVVVGGMPACECDAGMAGIPVAQGQAYCVSAGATYGPEQLLWPSWPPPHKGDDDDDDGWPDDDDNGTDDDDNDWNEDDDDRPGGGGVPGPTLDGCSCQGSVAGGGGATLLALLLPLAWLRRRG